MKTHTHGVRVAHCAHYSRGYTAPEQARSFIKECHTTRVAWSCTAALADHARILALAALGTWAYLHLPKGWMILLYPLLAMAIARFQRGLECLVHEASHYNWLRSHHGLNDLVANWLVARSVFSEVKRYREGHRSHHVLFGSEHDTDLVRYQELAIEKLDRSNALRFASGLLQRIGRYVAGWWRANRTNPGAFLLGLYWHLVVLVLPLGLFFGLRTALLVWVIFWLVPFAFVLPWQRFLAEAAKHQYLGHDTEFDSTVSNIGVLHRWLLHPHNDGFHLVHHLFPGIPHHQLRRAHHGLCQLDSKGFGRTAKRRLHLLEAPGHDTTCAGNQSTS